METLQDTFGEYNIRGGVFQDRIKFSFGDRKYLDVFDEEKKKKYRVSLLCKSGINFWQYSKL